LCLLASSSGVVRAAELQLQPADVALTGPGATQRMLAVAVEGKQVVGDRTGQAKFTSSNPAVANVTESGVVQAVGDGVATITAAHEGQQASAKVKVTKTQEPAAESFRNQIIPILTRNGCNSGACHGALAGKGGLKLSLRGYDPEADHFALTRQAGARRIDRQEPAKSLLLRKATLTMDHGGG
ncbi:MAG: hypothetical protein JNL98_44095, partial [Bryobacterales bacterium]|nr:hypothetical protein [Bryobacterales bacterium]